MSDAPTAVSIAPEPTDEKRNRGARRAMMIGRIIGWIFLIAALAVLVRDVLASIDAGSLVLIATGELWFSLHNGSLNLIQAVTQRYVSPSLWDPVIVTVLLWPAVLVLGVPGIVLSWLFRARRRKTGMFKS